MRRRKVLQRKIIRHKKKWKRFRPSTRQASEIGGIVRYILVLLAIVINNLAFQNCQSNNFAKALESGALVEKAGTDDQSETVGGEIPVVGTGGTTGSAGTMGTASPPATECARPGNGNGKSPICTETPKAPGDPNAGDGDGLYVCVLAGPGHSIKLGYMSNVLAGKVATPDDVCMSAKACTDIVSQFFRVKEPARRGFCPDKNPHVHHLTDLQIQTLINSLKK